MQHRAGAGAVRLLVILAVSGVAAWTLAGGALTWSETSAGARAALAATAASPVALTADRSDVSPPLRALAATSRQRGRPPGRTGAAGVEQPLGRRPFEPGARQRRVGRRDPVIGPGVVPPVLPGPLLSFDGARDVDNVASGHNGCGSRSAVAPSDSEGDVGPDHYVEWVNCVIQIFDKNGRSLLDPVDGNVLFAGLGGACETINRGDPIVLYDRQADRWLLSQFATPAGGPSHQCLAISQTPDPTGAYYRYDFVWPRNKLNDYAKLGIWPDAWYLTANQFDQSLTAYLGVGVVAFDRASMVRGGPGAAIYVDMETFAPASFGLLPSHLNGSMAPPTGSPNYLVEVESPSFDPAFTSDRLQVWKFHADFRNPASSTFTGPTILDVEPFDPLLCGLNPFDQFCVPQPGTDTTLDALPDRLMYRNNYRRFDDHEALVFNQAIDGTGTDVAGIRWYELRINAGVPSLFQQGTFAPDGVHRWMGSANVDAAGNIAIGYSASSETVFPSLRYAGRRPTDPLGTLGQGEGVLHAGGGSQTNPGRWGDYSSLSVDPTDDCTFWYVNQYYAVSGAFNWRTRITTFKLPGCAVSPLPPPEPSPPVPTPTSTPTPAPTPTTVQPSEVPPHDDKDQDHDAHPRYRARTPEQRQAQQRTDASSLDDTHISGNVLDTHLDESPPWIVIANRDGNVKVVLYEDIATLTVRVGQYFSGTGEKQHEQLFWAYNGAVE